MLNKLAYFKKGIKVKVIPSQFKEDLNKANFKSPIDYAVEYSRLKALEVAETIKVDTIYRLY